MRVEERAERFPGVRGNNGARASNGEQSRQQVAESIAAAGAEDGAKTEEELNLASGE